MGLHPRHLTLLLGTSLAVALGAVACNNTPDASDLDGNGGNDLAAASGDAAVASHVIGGNVSGLLGAGLVLRNNGGNDLPIVANGGFEFSAKVAEGAPYQVTVASQPSAPSQTCTVSGAAGTVGKGDVSTVTVNCTTNAFTLGGDVAGLDGTLVLTADVAGNASQQASLTANGQFAFPTPLPDGSAYSVSITTMPTGSVCGFVGTTDAGTSTSGTIAGGNVTSLGLRCAKTPTVNAIADTCGPFAGSFQWSEVPGASYLLEYGLEAGQPVTVELAAGTTSYHPVQPLGVGTYSFRVRSVREGVQSDYTAASTFTVRAVPTAPVAMSSGPACGGDTLSLTATSVVGATYAWTGPNGFAAAVQNPTLSNVQPVASGTYSVTATVDGCTSSAGTTSVLVNATPAAPTITVPSLACTGQAVALSAAPVQGGTFAWTGPNGFAAAVQNPTIANAALTDAGTYSATVTVAGCVSLAATGSLAVNATPATPTAGNSGPMCAGGGLSLTASSIPNATYAWTGPNGFSAATQNPTLANAGPAASGTYTVVATVDGCSSGAASTTAVVNAANPGQFLQTTTADFDANTNTKVSTVGDELAAIGVDTGNGVDGAYHATVNTALAGGTYNFTSFVIDAGVTVTVTGNAPLILRVQGAVDIKGVLAANGADGGPGVTFVSGGAGGAGVAGGGKGGDGTYSVPSGPLDGAPGSGPGGGGQGTGWSGGGGAGHASAGASATAGRGTGGPTYGDAALPVVEAGSGGGGGSGGFSCGSGGGGGGGGYIEISGTSIIVDGSVQANGGTGGSDGTGNCGAGGGGSGGAILLRSNTITLNGSVSASGGGGGGSTIGGSPYFGIGGAGSEGRVRFFAGLILGAGTSTPAATTGASTGVSITPTISPANLCRWGTVTFNGTSPLGTSVTVDVLDAANNVLASNVASGTALGSIAAVAAESSIRLRVSLTAAGIAAAASLQDWALAYFTQ